MMEALQSAGKTRSQLSEEIGVSAASISNWMLGKVGALHGQTATRIEAVTGVRAQWIMNGEGPKFVGDDQGGGTGGKRSIPAISRAMAACWPESQDPYAGGNRPDWLVSGRPMSGKSFALLIEDRSMAPVLSPGDHAIVDPAIEPAPGSLVAADVQGHGVVLRKYRPRRVDASGVQEFELAAINDDFPTVSSSDAPIKVLGTVVEQRRYL